MEERIGAQFDYLCHQYPNLELVEHQHTKFDDKINNEDLVSTIVEPIPFKK